MSEGARGILLTSGATILWSLSGLFVRFMPGIDSWSLNAWRAGSMAVFVLIWLGLRYGRNFPSHLSRSDPIGLGLAALFFAASSSFYLVALNLASVAAVSCLCATAPLFTAGLARLALGERTSTATYIAILVALCGVAIIAYGETEARPTGFMGVIVSLGVALGFAGQSVVFRRYRGTEMAPAMVLGGLLCFLGIGLWRGFAPPPPAILGLTAMMGLLQLAIPLILYIAAARSVPAVTMVLISLADAFLNPFWVWLVHGEVPAAAIYPGGGLILGAILFAIGGRRRKKIGNPT